MEKCDKTGINSWWLGRDPGKKRIATVALEKDDRIWKKNWKTKLTTRIRLFGTLVQNVLLYNCGTWGFPKYDQRKLNSFHRRQLRKVIGIQ